MRSVVQNLPALKIQMLYGNLYPQRKIYHIFYFLIDNDDISGAPLQWEISMNKLQLNVKRAPDIAYFFNFEIERLTIN